jgi:hypothetical protein
MNLMRHAVARHKAVATAMIGDFLVCFLLVHHCRGSPGLRSVLAISHSRLRNRFSIAQSLRLIVQD